MEQAIKLLTVFGLGAVELWAAVPAGLALGLHPVATGIAAAGGAVAGILAVVFLGEQVRARLFKRRDPAVARGRYQRLHRIWDRYGVVGLGLLAPLLTGAPLGTVLGLFLGASAGRLVLWMGSGIVLWTVLLILAGLLGLAGINTLKH
ncbi:small multi-drug export protein [Desulforudis sp. 1088]|uniref:small multi-drug export protein n=1 Tax=unclassified Candidatus Desulforudis TaxID=2635950 RepID=UPI003CE55966